MTSLPDWQNSRIRPNTRVAHARSATSLIDWLAEHEVTDVREIRGHLPTCFKN